MPPLRVSQLTGFGASRGGPSGVLIDTSQNHVDLYALLGSPTQARAYRIIIPTAVVVGATSAATPALYTGTSFTAGTTFVIQFVGTAAVIARGGAGGDGGQLIDSKIGGQGGGGGGGRGSGIAPGGAAGGPSSFPGQNGTQSAAGLGGDGLFINGTGSSSALPGGAGGTGIETHYDLTIDAQTSPGGSGRIYGGGGAGAGGDASADGGDGGDYGEDGEDTVGFAGTIAGGSAGAAIVALSGATITYLPSKGALDIRGAAP